MLASPVMVSGIRIAKLGATGTESNSSSRISSNTVQDQAGNGYTQLPALQILINHEPQTPEDSYMDDPNPRAPDKLLGELGAHARNGTLDQVLPRVGVSEELLCRQFNFIPGINALPRSRRINHMEYHIETEQDLRMLIGQYESIRLEFKASGLLLQPTERILKQLSEEVSALANTDGGVIIIGIKKGKSGKRSVAAEIDEGIDPARMPPERLEQLVASTISPPVPGLFVRPIPLSGQKSGRVVFVINVPKGTTAYQATDSRRYYGRTEFAAVPLHDNVIRLLMTRDTFAHAVIELGSVSCLTAEADYRRRQAELEAHLSPPNEFELVRVPEELRAKLEAPERDFDEYSFDIVIRNDGPITIRDALLSLAVKALPSQELTREDMSQPWQFRSGGKVGPWRLRFAEVRKKRVSPSGTEETESLAPVLFPEESMPYRNARFTVQGPKGQKAEAFLEWRLYLDDAPTSCGTVDLGHVFQEAHERKCDTPGPSTEGRNAL